MQAQQLTEEYLKTEEKNELDKEKVFIVYKFVNTPLEALIAGM
jgi:hypothetical protein